MRTHLRRSITVVVALFVLSHGFSAAAQMGGKGRFQGSVVDKATGKPVAGATITISGGNTKPVVTKSNAKGQWSALGLTGGTWSIDIEAPGYETLRGSATISEMQMAPPIRSELAPAAVEATVPVEAGPMNVPDTVVDAVNEAQELLRIEEGDAVTKEDGTSATATAADVKANSAKASTLLDKALPEIPTDTEERKRIRVQIQQLLAQAHYKAGNLARATEVQQELVAADETNQTNALLLVNLYLEGGQLAEGKALLEKLPDGAVSDSTVYLNVGILFLNKDSTGDALTYFDKAIALDASKGESYYYRGLANVRLQKAAEAKADFVKVIALAPDSAEAKDARQMLAGMK
jgi:hypothetical protein